MESPWTLYNGSAVLFFCALCKPCANHRHARMALVTLEGHCVWLTPISRGRVSHSDSGLNTVGGVLSCPWFVNDWHSLRIMTLSKKLFWIICLKVKSKLFPCCSPRQSEQVRLPSVRALGWEWKTSGSTASSKEDSERCRLTEEAGIKWRFFHLKEHFKQFKTAS